MGLFREERRKVGRTILNWARSLKELFFDSKSLPTIQNLPQRVLIIRPFFLGDILLCLPIAQAIKRQRPDVKMSWLLRDEWISLLQDHSDVEDIIAFSTKPKRFKALSEFLRVLKELRRRKFDLVINLTWDRSSILWSYFSGAPVRLGIEEYGRPRFLSLLATKTVVAPERNDDQTHMADFYYEALRLLGFEPRSELPIVFSTEEEQELVEQRLTATWEQMISQSNPAQKYLKLPGNKQSFVIVHPGARLKYKRWPLERFAEMILHFLNETEFKVILVCGPGEELWVANLGAALASDRCFFWPSPSLGEFIALAERADLFIGNDTGTTHLAAASGCPIIGIFGGDSKRWEPLGVKSYVVRGNKGLESITTDQILMACNKAVL
jgi:heptosyltransferase III